VSRDPEMDRLYAEARARAKARAEAYWKNPPPPRTEEQEREFQKRRRDAARAFGCDVSRVYWHGPDQAWSCR
jgi:hypothetical protein